MRVYVGGLNHRVGERDIDSFFKSYSGVGEIVMKNGFAFVEFDDRREGEDAIYEMNGKDLLGGRVTVEKATGTPRPSRTDFGDRGSRDRGGYQDRNRFGGSRNGNGGGGGGGGGFRDRGDRDYGRMRRMPGQKSRFPTRTQYRLVVSNLSSQVSWQDLKDFMRQAGEVTYADAHKQHQNEGVIEFATRSDMKAALDKLDGKDLHGRRIKLYPEKDASGSPSRKGGRRSWSSHSRSRTPRSRSRSPASRSRSRSRSAPPRKNKSRTRSRSRSFSPYAGRAKRDSPRRSSASRSRSRDRD